MYSGMETEKPADRLDLDPSVNIRQDSLNRVAMADINK